MNYDVLPGASEEPGLPVSGVAVLAGVLAAYGAFALLISIVAAFANGAHSHQVLSGATWKQLGTGGGVTAGIVLFLAWAAGGFIAARMARRDGIRHGVWVFIVGVVLITVVGAAITWLPDTTAILRNLRLLGLPVRRNEWRDIGTVAGIASLVGMAAGAAFGGRLALRERAATPGRAPAGQPAVVPEAAPAAPPAAVPSPPQPMREEARPEPAVAAPSLFEQIGSGPEPAGERVEAQAEGTSEPMPAWQQYVEARQREIRERDRERTPDEGFAPLEPPPATPTPTPAAPWTEAEPVPTFISEPSEAEPEPAPVTSFWPQQEQPEAQPEAPEAQPARPYDEDWALPDEAGAPGGADTPEGAAFPHPQQSPVSQPAPEPVEVVPAEEHADWRGEDESYRSPPEPTDDDVLQQAPEAPPPEVEPEELEERRRQQEEAARAYEQAREEPSP